MDNVNSTPLYVENVREIMRERGLTHVKVLNGAYKETKGVVTDTREWKDVAVEDVEAMSPRTVINVRF